MKLESLFPVQKQVIPYILNSNYLQSIYPNDICVTAPTGSGKTLTYVLPIIENLKSRIRPCCRAIVILPVSDLAEQVYNVFKTYLVEDYSNLLEPFINISNSSSIKDSKNNLRVMLLSNKTQFTKEQAQLIDKEHEKCLIDIIVTTPGRLVDHIQKTKGFYLNELRYLVIDECDRIIDQIKQNWLPILNKAVFGINDDKLDLCVNRELLNQERLNVHNLFIDKKKLMPFQKILLSATLTKDPEKLEQLDLFKPIYFSIGAEKLKSTNSIAKSKEPINKLENTSDLVESTDVKETAEIKKSETSNEPNIQMPEELNEFLIQVVPQEKPLTAIYLIKTLGYKNMLCFVKSKETAKRLNKLFELNNIKSMEYSSSLHAARRKRVQTKFQENKLDVLVCSDVMARGMDLTNVDYVLLYDAPKFLSSYIHKVGRTARAGRSGTSITFLEKKEIYFFKKMIAEIGSTNNPLVPTTNENTNPKPKHKVKEIKIQKSKLKPLLNDYKNSLGLLKKNLANISSATNNKKTNEIKRKFKKDNTSTTNNAEAHKDVDDAEDE